LDRDVGAARAEAKGFAAVLVDSQVYLHYISGLFTHVYWVGSAQSIAFTINAVSLATKTRPFDFSDDL
jgi:hypothetical protein